MPESFAIPSFRNHLPVRIHFGEGISEILPSLLAAEGVSRAALIINPPAAKVLADIEASGITITRYDKPAGEPTVDMIDAAAAVLKSSNAQAVIALGGGSVIDTAKAARLCASVRL